MRTITTQKLLNLLGKTDLDKLTKAEIELLKIYYKAEQERLDDRNWFIIILVAVLIVFGAPVLFILLGK